MNSNSVFAETKKERQLKELAFLSILYFCVTVAIVTLMTLIYDVISTGYSRLFIFCSKLIQTSHLYILPLNFQMDL